MKTQHGRPERGQVRERGLVGARSGRLIGPRMGMRERRLTFRRHDRQEEERQTVQRPAHSKTEVRLFAVIHFV